MSNEHPFLAGPASTDLCLSSMGKVNIISGWIVILVLIGGADSGG
jgi:hypothetical protein